MMYPVLLLSRCEQLAEQKVEGQDPAIEPHVTWLGTGDEVDLDPLKLVATQIDTEMRELPFTADRDQFEGQMAPHLFQALGAIPIEILDDRGFWSYMSLNLFWDFIAWREEAAFRKRNHLKYVNGQSGTEAVLNRMYVRAKAVGGQPYADLAGALPQSTDFWRSHVTRVQTGLAPALTRAFTRMQMDQRLTTDPLRSLARNLNRTWTNVVLHTYTEEESTNLLAELREPSTGPTSDSA